MAEVTVNNIFTISKDTYISETGSNYFKTQILRSQNNGNNYAIAKLTVDIAKLNAAIVYGTLNSITLIYTTECNVNSGGWDRPTTKVYYINSSGSQVLAYTHSKDFGAEGSPKTFNTDKFDASYKSNNGTYEIVFRIENEQKYTIVSWANVTDIKLKLDYTPHTCNFSIESSRTPATCTTAGSVTKKCSVSGCGQTQTSTLAALGHSYGGASYTWSSDGKSCAATRVCSTDSSHKETATATITSKVKTAATCTVKGTTTYTATFGVSWATTQTKDVQDIAVKSHTWVDATCTTPKKCSVCGATSGSALGHDYKSVVTAPTESSRGYTTHTCTRCGDSYVDSYTYLITFKNGDGTTLETVTVAHGTTPQCSKTPTKASTAEYTYTFNNTWQPALGAATANQVYTPNFTSAKQIYHCDLHVQSGGIITGAQDGDYEYGTVLTVTAVPDPGYEFESWMIMDTINYDTNPSVTLYQNPLDVRIEYNTGVIAKFKKQKYTIVTSVSPTGSGSITGAGTYEYEDTATLTATPHSGYEFVQWSDGVTDNPRKTTITGVATYTAYFRVNKLLLDTNKPKKIYIDTQEVKEIYIDTTKVYG